MSKYLALEWDEHEIRVAIASQRGATAVLERALAAPLPPAADGKPHDAATVGRVLREALAGESLRKVETLAVVGRTSIELKELSLPPAPDEEMPDLVRFQALRDFTQLTDDAPLDFIALPGQDAEHRSVLAAAISIELLSEIRETCEQAGLGLNHLVLRPCASASLLRRHQPAADQVRMFVDLLGDEVDLTVLDQDTPLLMRTTRLPGDASQPEFCRPVFLEIRRTIAAVQNKLHGRKVEKIWLCGDGPSQQTLSEMVKSELDLPTELFDPFTAFEQAGSMRESLPAHHSRFAPLLGMLADAAAGERHAIDFLDPRQRPVPTSRQREAVIAAAAVSVMLLMFVGWTWWRLRSLDDRIVQLSRQHSQLTAQNRKNVAVEKEALELERWMDGDVPWLDVLHRLSTHGPKAEEAMLTGLKADVDKTGGGKLTLDVLATGSSKVGKELVAVYPKTKLGKIDPDDKVKRYPVKFKAEGKIDQEAIDAIKKSASKKVDGKSQAKEADGKSAAGKDDKKKATDPKPLDSKAPAAKAEAPIATSVESPKGGDAKSEAVPVASDKAQPAAAEPTAAEPTAAEPAVTAPQTKASPSATAQPAAEQPPENTAPK